jgi:hypothetical protein
MIKTCFSLGQFKIHLDAPALASRPSHLSGRRRVVIACGVMEPELTKVLAEGEEYMEILYLDQVLHRTPTKLFGQLQ